MSDGGQAKQLAYRITFTLIVIPLTLYVLVAERDIAPPVLGILITITTAVTLFWAQYKPPEETARYIYLAAFFEWVSFLSLITVTMLILFSPELDAPLKYLACFYAGVTFALWFIRIT